MTNPDHEWALKVLSGDDIGNDNQTDTETVTYIDHIGNRTVSKRIKISPYMEHFFRYHEVTPSEVLYFVCNGPDGLRALQMKLALKNPQFKDI